MKLPVSRFVVRAGRYALAFVGVIGSVQIAGAQPTNTPAPAPAPAAPAPPPDPIANFEIYGTIVPIVEIGRTSDATSLAAPRTATQVQVFTGSNAPARGRMDMGTSNLGFRGGIDVMKNLSVVFQIESGVQADGTPVANTIASRNSHVGIAGSFGTLLAGQWDTPYKQSTVQIVNPIRAGFLPDYNGILHSPGFGVQSVTTQASRINGPADAAFDRRAGNSIQYWSPTYQGLWGRVAYSLTEGRTARTAAVPSIKPSLFSGLLAYDRGPLKLRYSYEVHLDYFGMTQLGGAPPSNNNTSSTDQAHQAIAMYTHPTPGFETRVLGIFEHLSYSNDQAVALPAPAINANKFSRPAIYGLIDQTLFGKHKLWGTFGMAFDGSCEVVGGGACETEGLGASMAVLGYVYRASKTTDFFAVGYRITNKASASYSTSPGLGGPAAPGADVEAFGIGMLYTFSAKVGVGSKPPAPPAPPPPPPPPVVEPPPVAPTPPPAPTPAP